MARFFLLTLVVAVVGAVLLLPASGGDRARAAFPGANGKIAFTVFTSDKSPLHIYVMNGDGSGVTNLTNDSADALDPAWSPDGTKIAFTSGSGVSVMNADGSGRTDLSNNPIDSEPAWSPDGAKIAFASERDDPNRDTCSPNCNSEIYVMNADGSGVTRLTNDTASDASPAWSPDGTKIAFTSDRDGNREIYVMNPDGSGATNLTNDPAGETDPAWSPDGAKIAFRRPRDGNDEIYVMNADGTGQTGLTHNTGAYNGQPAWSPDGTKIAFTNFMGGFSVEVDVMNADGSSVTRLTDRLVAFSANWQPLPGLGDVNCQGGVNSIDAVLVLQLGAHLLDSLPCIQNADVDHDGAANSIDAAIILQYTAGLLAHLPP